jgi:hypothetical protein
MIPDAMLPSTEQKSIGPTFFRILRSLALVVSSPCVYYMCPKQSVSLIPLRRSSYHFIDCRLGICCGQDPRDGNISTSTYRSICAPKIASFVAPWLTAVTFCATDFVRPYSSQSGNSSSGHNNPGPGSANNSSSSNLNQNSNNTGPNSDYSKKEEFRRYLEKTGVLDAFTKVLVGLYEEPERPINAVDYIKRYLGAPPNIDVEGLRRENESLKAQLETLRRQQHHSNNHQQHSQHHSHHHAQHQQNSGGNSNN